MSNIVLIQLLGLGFLVCNILGWAKIEITKRELVEQGSEPMHLTSFDETKIRKSSHVNNEAINNITIKYKIFISQLKNVFGLWHVIMLDYASKF